MTRNLFRSALLGATASLVGGAALAESPRKVTVTYADLTGTQPMSSSAFASHGDGLHLWTKPAARVTIAPVAKPAS